MELFGLSAFLKRRLYVSFLPSLILKRQTKTETAVVAEPEVKEQSI